jgi:hypothetical protein
MLVHKISLTVEIALPECYIVNDSHTFNIEEI